MWGAAVEIKRFSEITTTQLVRICGFSQGTVDRALHNRECINPKTREYIYDYGYLGVKKYLKGDEEDAIRCFKESVRLTKAFDSLPDVYVSTSLVVRSAIFEKEKSNLRTDKMLSRVEYLFSERYPLSEDCKNNATFKKLISSIK